MEEFKKRRIKPGKRKREAMVDLLNKEDKNQRRIVWAKQAREDAGPKTELRGEEEEGEEVKPQPRTVWRRRTCGRT